MTEQMQSAMIRERDRPVQIKITSEMRRVGSFALDAALGSHSQEEMADAIYRAMRPLEPE